MSYEDDLRTERDMMADEVKRLQAIVDKLEKTEDDVPITQGMTLYAIGHEDDRGVGTGEILTLSVGKNNTLASSMRNARMLTDNILMYSTHEAAEAARDTEENQ